MKKGYTILIITLVLAAVGILLITTVNFLGVDEIKTSVNHYNSSLGLYLSTSCAEEALELIKSSSNPDNYQQINEKRISITFPENITHYCWYSVRGRGKNPKYIYTRSEVPNFPRKLEIKLIQNEPITIGWWQER